MRFFTIISTIALFMTISLAADDSAAAIYRDAVEMYRLKDYEAALDLFNDIVVNYSTSAESEESSIMLAESGIRTGTDESLEKSRFALDVFFKKYKGSEYGDRAHYLYGIIETKHGNIMSALKHFTFVINRTMNPRLFELSSGMVKEHINGGLSPDELMLLYRNLHSNDELKALCLFRAGRRHLSSKEYESALLKFETCIDSFPESWPADSSRILTEIIDKRAEKNIRVGIIVPLSGEYDVVGKKVLMGIKQRVADYNRTAATKIELLVRDNEANTVRTYRIADELINKNKVKAIIGPVKTEPVVAASALAADAGIPVISPTATDDGLAGLNKSLFLMNVSTAALARNLALYAYDSLKIKEYSVIYPNSDYGHTIMKHFLDVLNRDDVEILTRSSYEVGARNIREQLNEIRKIKAEEELHLRVARGDTSILNKEDSLSVDEDFLNDSLISCGAVLLAGHPDDILNLAPQIPHRRIETQILGCMGWNFPKIYTRKTNGLEGTVISVDFLLDKSSENWKSFQGKYKIKYGEFPDKFSALGYDAAELLLRGVDNYLEGGAQDIGEGLDGVKMINGVSGKIEFDFGRSNVRPIILKILNRKTERLN
ncbi:MAG: ABC transporter substrate-binding protein [Fibrobacterota bacterium]